MSAFDDLISASIGTTGADFIACTDGANTLPHTPRINGGGFSPRLHRAAFHLLISIAFNYSFARYRCIYKYQRPLTFLVRTIYVTSGICFARTQREGKSFFDKFCEIYYTRQYFFVLSNCSFRLMSLHGHFAMARYLFLFIFL